MYSFEKTKYGLKMQLTDFFSFELAQDFYKQYAIFMEEMKKENPNGFCQFGDLRGYKAGPPEAQKYINDAMHKFKEVGGKRSIVLFDNPVTVMQIKRLAKQSGIDQGERYIDSQTYPDFEKIVHAWLVDAVDPEG